jgi:sporulation protein YlmC with PRC-barrel domain
MIADPATDVRGRKVVDKAGEEIGSIDDLMIDDDELKIRFLRVVSGGFIGIGETMFLIPVDAVMQVTHDAVQIDQTREHVAGGPGYDPELVTNETYWNNVYSYYGYRPYWTPGYRYPTDPWNPLTSPLRGASLGSMADPSAGVPGDVAGGSTAAAIHGIVSPSGVLPHESGEAGPPGPLEQQGKG